MLGDPSDRQNTPLRICNIPAVKEGWMDKLDSSGRSAVCRGIDLEDHQQTAAESWPKFMAERGGFEPPIPVKVCPLSRRIVSTTHAPLRVGQSLIISHKPLLTKKRLQRLCAVARQHTSCHHHLMV